MRPCNRIRLVGREWAGTPPGGAEPGGEATFGIDAVQPVISQILSPGGGRVNADSLFRSFKELLEAARIRHPRPRNGARIPAHAFIASRGRPGVSLGVALQRAHAPLGHTAFEPVRALLPAL